MRLLEKSGTLQILDSLKESAVKEDVSDLVNNEDDVLLGSEDLDGVDVSGREPIASFYVGRGNADPGIEIYEIDYNTDDRILARDLAKLDEEGQAHWYTIEYEFEDEEGNELDEGRAFADVDGVKVYMDECIKTNLQEAEQTIDIFVDPERDYKITDVTMLEPIDDGDVRAIDMQSILIGLDESLTEKYGEGWGEFNIQSSRTPRGKIDENDISYVLHVLDINGHQEILNYNTKGTGRIREAFITNYKGKVLESKRCTLSRIPKFFMEATEEYIDKYGKKETIGDLLAEIDNALTVGEIEAIGKRFKNELDRKVIEDEIGAIEEEYGDVYEMDEDSEEYYSIIDELKSCISSDFSGQEENLNESLKEDAVLPNNGYIDQTGQNLVSDERIQDSLRRRVQRLKARQKLLKTKQTFGKDGNVVPVDEKNTHGKEVVDGEIGQETEPITDTKIKESIKEATDEEARKMLSIQDWMESNDFEDRWEEGAGWAEPTFEFMKKQNYNSFVREKRDWVAYKDREALTDFDEMVKSLNESVVTLDTATGTVDLDGNVSHVTVDQDGTMTAVSDGEVITATDNSVEVLPSEETIIADDTVLEPNGDEIVPDNENVLDGEELVPEEPETAPEDEVVETEDIAMAEPVPASELEEGANEEVEDTEIWCRGKIYWAGNHDRVTENLLLDVADQATEEEGELIDVDEVEIKKIEESLKESSEDIDKFWASDIKAGDKIVSSGAGEVEVLDLDKGKDYILVKRGNEDTYQPYVAAWAPQLDDEGKLFWGQGHYFDTEEAARKYMEGLTESLKEATLAEYIPEEKIAELLKQNNLTKDFEGYELLDGNLVRLAKGDVVKTFKIYNTGANWMISEIDANGNYIGEEVVFYELPDEVKESASLSLNESERLTEAVEEKIESEIEGDDVLTKEETIEEDLVPSAIFHRKPSNVDSMRKEEDNKVVTAKSTYTVKDVKEVDEGEFNDLCNNLQKDRDYIKEFADTVEADNSVTFNCLEVKGPNGSLLIDPSGYGYARYCAFGDNIIEEPTEEVEEEIIEEPIEGE